MLRRIIKFIVAVYFVTITPPHIENALPFGQIGKSIFPKSEDAPGADLIELFIWAAVYYVLIELALKVGAFLIGGGLSRFDGTKPVRRIQGVAAEILMIFLIWLAGTLVFTGAAFMKDQAEYQEKISIAAEPPKDIFGNPIPKEKQIKLGKRFTISPPAYWDTFLSIQKKWIILFSIIAWVAIRSAFREKFSILFAAFMRFLDEGRMGFGGSGRFARMFEEWSKPYKPGSLFMGRSLYNPFQEIGLSGEAHMLTVAGSRTGKGVTAIIPNLLLWPHSCVVIDPKGTNAHVTAQARRDMGHDVYLIDPFKIVTDKSDSFDPFAGLNPADDLVRERIASITDALVIPDTAAKDKHWDEGARTIISGLISHVIGSHKFDPPTLPKIRDLINQMPEDQDRLWAEMSQNSGGGGYAKDAAMRYIRGSDTNEMLNIMSNADKHTEWLSSKAMRGVVSNPTFKLSALKEKPTTVYLIIPPRQIKRQSRLLRLFVNLMIDTIEHGGKSKTPVLMILDEFQNLGVMPEIEDAFATMASYNLVLWPFVQNLAKLKKDYGSVDTFIANARAVQVFGISDPDTKEYISKRMGNRPLSALGQVARSNENLPLRTPDDIEKDVNKDSGRQYIIEAGKPPLLLEKVPYFASQPVKFLTRFDMFKNWGRFCGKYYPDPDHSKASKSAFVYQEHRAETFIKNLPIVKKFLRLIGEEPKDKTPPPRKSRLP